MTLDEYFAGNIDARSIFDCLQQIIESNGSAEVRVQQSQIAFLKKTAFAYVTMPRKLHQGKGAPLILSISLRRREPSPRWKKVQPLPSNWFTHYIELSSPNEVDDQVCSWLQEAWELAA